MIPISYNLWSIFYLYKNKTFDYTFEKTEKSIIKKRYRYIIILFIFLTIAMFILFFSNYLINNSIANKNYIKSKNEFKQDFTSHFPDRITTEDFYIDFNNDREKNNVGIILYEYDLDKNDINSVKNDLRNLNVIGKYSSKDTCLLIVNRYESSDTSENKKREAQNDLILCKPCFNKLYPIPNFIGYQFRSKNSALKLDTSFEIYVIDAKNSNISKFNLKPDSQMPNNWETGYSKGIAISDAKNTIIYWSIIW